MFAWLVTLFSSPGYLWLVVSGQRSRSWPDEIWISTPQARGILLDFRVGNPGWCNMISICLLVLLVLGGSSQLVSSYEPPFISHLGYWKGNNPQLGDLLTMVLNHLQVLAWSSKWGNQNHELPVFPTKTFTTFHLQGYPSGTVVHAPQNNHQLHISLGEL